MTEVEIDSFLQVHGQARTTPVCVYALGLKAVRQRVDARRYLPLAI